MMVAFGNDDRFPFLFPFTIVLHSISKQHESCHNEGWHISMGFKMFTYYTSFIISSTLLFCLLVALGSLSRYQVGNFINDLKILNAFACHSSNAVRY